VWGPRTSRDSALARWTFQSRAKRPHCQSRLQHRSLGRALASTEPLAPLVSRMTCSSPSSPLELTADEPRVIRAYAALVRVKAMAGEISSAGRTRHINGALGELSSQPTRVSQCAAPSCSHPSGERERVSCQPRWVSSREKLRRGREKG
jgi:hypothetical protein